jgi:hypothetical protein
MTCLIAPYTADFKRYARWVTANIEIGIVTRYGLKYGLKLPAHMMTDKELEELEMIGENTPRSSYPFPIICER